ncbi:MAG: alpha/beta fold hydrolase [Chloroflexi bacterium]|nr:alpha/beta fold hydrolase [Chloroflexota bacterium]
MGLPNRGATGPLTRWADPPWTVHGPADAPAIVFLHGAIVLSMWGPQVDRLGDRYRCVVVDLPGHGRLAGQRFGLDVAVEIVRAAIDEAAGGRALVVGLSLGGYVAMALAAEHPERVRGLVVADASLEPRGLGAIGIVAYGWFLRLMPAWLVREVGVGLFRRPYGRRLAAELGVGYDSKAGGSAILQLPGQRFRDRLAAYGGPVLVLNGDRDAIFTAGERRLAGGLPNVAIQRIAGAAHLSSVDRPDEFTAAVATFEASLPA